MTDMELLQLEALEACAFRGHTMGPWREHGLHGSRVAVCNCTVCDMMACVDSNPPPNGIDVSGSAVARSCPNRDLVRQWMKDNAADYDDGIDINCTRMAEDAADQYDIYDDDIDFTIPEWVYELAVEVEAWYLAPKPYWYEETDDEDESEDW